jgi:hypothetical protein
MLNSAKDDDDNAYVYNKEEVEARAKKHLEEYAAQGKKATVQFKDSGRYTITILEAIDGLTKLIFQTFDENDDKIERTTVTMSNNQKTKLDNGIDTPYIIGTSESSNINFLANQIQYVNIQGTFAPLVKPVKITPDSHLIVEMYVFNDIQSTFNLSIYNTLSQPSSFVLTIPYQTIQIVEGGAIGQQYLHTTCNYNATATSSLGVGYVFDIDSELVNNTEHKFIARITDLSQHLSQGDTFIRVASGGVEIPVIATFEDVEEQQPYFSEFFHKFLYYVDDNTSIIMFSAFYTNGEFIIVEPNDVDYADLYDIDNIINGTDVVGKAEADQLGNVIDTTYATKNELSNVNTKSLYHLGTYDNAVENADGTVTITRQTGYLVINAENIVSIETAGGSGITCALTNLVAKGIIVEADASTEVGKSSIGYECNGASGYWVGNNKIGLYQGNTDYPISIGNNSFTTIEQFRALCPVYIQYKLADPYPPEQVIPNRPLNTLDQQGSQWVRDEWEKGLNLFDKDSYDYHIGYDYSYTGSDWVNVGKIKVKPNTTYYCNKKINRIAYGSPAITTIDAQTFTTPSDCYEIQIFTYLGGTQTEATARTYYSDCMLNEGSKAYAYQPYNANKHITNDEAQFLKNVMPNFYQIKKFTGTWGQWVNTKGNDNVNVLKALVSKDISEDDYHYVDLIKTYDSVLESIAWVYLNSGSSSPFHDVSDDNEVIIYYVDLYEA